MKRTILFAITLTVFFFNSTMGQSAVSAGATGAYCDARSDCSTACTSCCECKRAAVSGIKPTSYLTYTKNNGLTETFAEATMVPYYKRMIAGNQFVTTQVIALHDELCKAIGAPMKVKIPIGRYPITRDGKGNITVAYGHVNEWPKK